MSKYTIKTYPQDVLRKISEPVTSFGKDLEKLVREMYKIMEDGKGIGLAAPQIGISENLLVYKTVGEKEEKNTYLVNPKIVRTEGAVTVEEGCLSLPGVYAKVPRAVKVWVEAQDAFGEPITVQTDAFSSIIIQHEYDHLIGKLFIDKLSPVKRKMAMSKYKG